MEGLASSNARVKIFFERDPIEFIDDVVMAMSHYVRSGIDSLSSVMVDVRLSDNHKRSFIRDLAARVKHSLDVNSDIFEMYVMRNIFHIPVDVDLAGSVVQSQESAVDDLDRSFGRDAESDELDEEIRALQAQIYKSNERRKKLVREAKQTEAKLKISKAALERMPAIMELAQAVEAVPSKRINELIQSMEDLLRRSRAAEGTEEVQSLAFQQAAFTFD
jgi:hypothetical protein